MSSIARMAGIGLVIDQDKAESYSKYGARLDAVKLLFKGYVSKGKGMTVKRVDALRRSYGSIVLAGLPDKALSEVMKSKHRSDVMIEFEFGYSERKLAQAMKKGVKAGVLVPFGKDWIKYAMNSAPEGYMRFVAGKLLKEGYDDAKIE
jgi:hypothetical protein